MSKMFQNNNLSSLHHNSSSFETNQKEVYVNKSSSFVPTRMLDKFNQVQSQTNLNGDLFITAHIQNSHIRSDKRFILQKPEGEKKNFKLCKFEE